MVKTMEMAVKVGLSRNLPTFWRHADLCAPRSSMSNTEEERRCSSSASAPAGTIAPPPPPRAETCTVAPAPAPASPLVKECRRFNPSGKGWILALLGLAGLLCTLECGATSPAVTAAESEGGPSGSAGAAWPTEVSESAEGFLHTTSRPWASARGSPAPGWGALGGMGEVICLRSHHHKPG